MTRGIIRVFSYLLCICTIELLLPVVQMGPLQRIPDAGCKSCQLHMTTTTTTTKRTACAYLVRNFNGRLPMQTLARVCIKENACIEYICIHSCNHIYRCLWIKTLNVHARSQWLWISLSSAWLVTSGVFMLLVWSFSQASDRKTSTRPERYEEVNDSREICTCLP
jgi:hypothetical protein